MRIVIKFAGALLEDAATVESLSQRVAGLARHGHEILVIHGGGRLFTATLKRLGIESKFVAGLRVTDRETRDVAVMVFAGLLNKRVAAAITASGQPAIGVSAADAACFSAAPLVHNDVEGSLGFVGYLTGVNTSFLQSLWRENLLPVAACLGLGTDGELYNINADHMAAACAEFICGGPPYLSHRRRRCSAWRKRDFRDFLRTNRDPCSGSRCFRRYGAETGSRQTRSRRRRRRSAYRWRRFRFGRSRSAAIQRGGQQEIVHEFAWYACAPGVIRRPRLPGGCLVFCFYGEE